VAETTVYEKPTCTTCRKLVALLEEAGIEFERVNYHVEPLTEEEIRELLRKAAITPQEALRRREPAYEQIGLAEQEGDDDAVIAAMARHPELLQRPIVVHGQRAVLARPPEKVLEILD
jgi:arsenate reductase (glutaredoxin)